MMKTKKQPAGRSKKAAAAPAVDIKRTDINVSPDDAKILRRCAVKCGQSVESLVREIMLDGLQKLDALEPTAIPCPFCLATDRLEIIVWSNERPDGSEYQGNAVRCHRCDAIAPLRTWIKNGLPGDSREASCKGGVA
jgi:hypothetical protein